MQSAIEYNKLNFFQRCLYWLFIISLIFGIFTFFFLAGILSSTNWKYIFGLLTGFNCIALAGMVYMMFRLLRNYRGDTEETRWLKKKPKKIRRHMIRMTVFGVIVLIGICFLYGFLARMYLLDLVSGPIRYRGSCTVEYSFSLRDLDDEVHLYPDYTYDDLVSLSKQNKGALWWAIQRQRILSAQESTYDLIKSEHKINGRHAVCRSGVFLQYLPQSKIIIEVRVL